MYINTLITIIYKIPNSYSMDLYCIGLVSNMNSLRNQDILTNFSIISDSIEYRVIYHYIFSN